MHTIHKPTLRQRMEEHLQDLAIQKFTETTIRGRRSLLDYFFKWCDERNVIYPTEVTKLIAEQYQAYLCHYRREGSGQPMEAGSQVNRLSAIRMFFKWMAKKHYILFNPTADLDLPKLPHKLPKEILTISETERVLAQPDITFCNGMRDRVIMEIFYSTGIRRMEMRKLKIKDIDFERGTLTVRGGKGNKDRVVPIGERALAWINKYLQDTRPQLVDEQHDEGYLFMSTIQKNKPLSMHSLTGTMRQYIRNAGIGKEGACHLFRHTMATLMLEHGADIRYIQTMLGHSKLETTQIYTRVSIKRLKEIHNATHPGAFLKRSLPCDELPPERPVEEKPAAQEKRVPVQQEQKVEPQPEPVVEVLPSEVPKTLAVMQTNPFWPSSGTNVVLRQLKSSFFF